MQSARANSPRQRRSTGRAAKPAGLEGWSYEVAHPDAAPDLAPIVGKNLRKLRLQRGLSLERLAKASGVSRAMLGQVELGHSAPTINVLWKIARAFDVPFASLITSPHAPGTRVLRANHAKKLMSHDGTFGSRALFPFDAARRVEFYELRLAARAVELADPHPLGTTENLVVSVGSVEIETGGERHLLRPGDAIFFEADSAHAYRNLGEREAVLYLVMTYAQEVG